VPLVGSAGPWALSLPRVLDALHWDLAIRHGWAAGRNPHAPDRVEVIAREVEAAFPGGDGQPDPIRYAARLATAIAQRPPYLAGNLALALVAILVALGRSGLQLQAPEGEAVAVLSALADRAITREQLTRWIMRYAAELTPAPRSATE
jgi:prophage maintenance system killer protein